MNIITLMAIAVAASSPSSGNVFDLNCRSTDGQWSSTYHLDLDAGLWCQGSCKDSWAFSRVTPAAIDLDLDQPGIDQKVSISRTSGYFAIASVKPTILIKEGQCSKTPATRTPVRAF